MDQVTARQHDFQNPNGKVESDSNDKLEGSALPGQVARAPGDRLGSESHARSLMKALSWRVVALAITTGVVFVITGQATLAATVGVADALLKIGTYYLHERAWNHSNLGRRSG